MGGKNKDMSGQLSESRIAFLEQKISHLKQECDRAAEQLRQFRELRRKQATDSGGRQLPVYNAENISCIGAWELDVLTNEWRFSDEWLSLHDCFKDILTPDQLLAINHLDEGGEFEPDTQETVNGLVPSITEYSIVGEDGKVRYIRSHVQYFRDSVGNLTRVYGFAMNVTEQKRIEENLLAMEQQHSFQNRFLETLLHNSPVGIAMIQGRKLLFSLVNEACQALCPETSMEGRTCREIFPQEAAAGLESLLLQVIETGESREHQFAAWETRMVPIPIAEGEEPSILFFISEGVESKRTGDEPLACEAFAQHEIEDCFRATFEQAAVGMAKVSLEGRFLLVNRGLCDIVGYSREELQQKTFMEITLAEDLAADLAQVSQLLNGECEHYQIEKRYIHKSGHIVWINLTGSLHRSRDGSPQFFISVIEDISERKAMEEKIALAKSAAEEASLAKSEFLASMSHEIRTPMTVFMAAIEHLLQIEKNPEHLHLLDMANQSADRLRLLIDDILDFSRIEARKVEVIEEPFELRACVREAAEMFELTAREKSLILKVTVAESVPQILVGDQGRLGQVLINLIGNAVKFTREGEVRIEVEPRGEFIEFCVADTGIGIPVKKHGLIFESFNQADNSSKGGGSGLGLAICKGLVELMGGEISMQSQEGKGSTFSFTLPLRERA